MSNMICGAAQSFQYEPCWTLWQWSLFMILLGAVIMFVIIIFFVKSEKSEPSKPRKILIKYTDGSKEECTGTEWERYDDHVTIFNNDLEDNIVKELNFDCLKSIEFA